ncbi:MAG: DUF885 domain-containing protein, partial [Gracilimonas sp.]
MRSIFTVLIFSLLTLTVSAQSISDMITTYRADHGALDRKYSVQPSDEYFERFDRFYAEWLAELEAMNFDALSHPEQVDYLLFRNDLERSFYFLNAEHNRFNNITRYLPAKDEIMLFINQRRVGSSMDGKVVAGRFNEWEKEIQAKKEVLKSGGVLAKREAAYLSDTIEELNDAIEEACKFYNGYDPDFTWWVEEPFKRLNDSLKTYADFAGKHFDSEK